MIPRALGLGLIAGTAECGFGLYNRLPVGTIGMFVGITIMTLLMFAALMPAEQQSPSDIPHRAMSVRLEDLALLKELAQTGMSAQTLVELFTDVMARMSQGLLTESDRDAYVQFLLSHAAGEPIPLSASDIRVSDPPSLSHRNFRFFAAGVNEVVRLIERLVAEHDVTPEELVRIMLRYAQLRTNEFDDGPLGLHLVLDPEAEFRWAEHELAAIRETYLVLA